jgi:hypothetical protein
VRAVRTSRPVERAASCRAATGDDRRLKQMFVARSTGVGRALTAYRMPIEGRDEWIAAAGRRLA